MSKNSAIMKFGEMLTHAANFFAVGAAGPSFAWASPNDIVILGKTPDDINGRVCLVSLPDDEKRRFVRLYRHGNTIKTYYMDDYDCSGEYLVDIGILRSCDFSENCVILAVFTVSVACVCALAVSCDKLAIFTHELLNLADSVDVSQIADHSLDFQNSRHILFASCERS